MKLTKNNPEALRAALDTLASSKTLSQSAKQIQIVLSCGGDDHLEDRWWRAIPSLINLGFMSAPEGWEWQRRNREVR